MKLYTQLSKVGFLKKSYAFKFLFVAFLGIHIPLIGIILFLVFFEKSFSPTTIFIFTLLLTLLATAITLSILKKLLAPVEKSSRALENYKNKRSLPTLPYDFTDEVGTLMANIQATVRNSESLLTQKQNLIFLLSHDLKNFASNPGGLAELILEEHPSESIQSHARMILESANQQTEFIKGILALMEEEEVISRQSIRVKNVNLAAIISGIKKELDQKLLAKDVTLSVTSELTELYLKIDTEMLTSVLSNLIDNAIKFSHVGSEIRLTLKKNHSDLEIKVSDDGIGFDSSKINSLFEKFTKLRRKGTANESTTGIGLYLCSQIIKKSDGVISGYSDGEGKGATFEVRLKVYRKQHS